MNNTQQMERDVNTVTFGWVPIEQTFAEGDTSKMVESVLFLSHGHEPGDIINQLITGVSLQLNGSSFCGISFQVKSILQDGTLGNTTTVQSNDYDPGDGQRSLTLEDNQVAVGIGVTVSHQKVSQITLYYRDWDSKMALLTGDTKFKRASDDSHDNTNPEKSWIADTHCFLQEDLSAIILIGLGLKCSNDNVSLVVATAGTLVAVTTTTSNEADQEISYEANLDPTIFDAPQNNAITAISTLILANYCQDAYIANYSDAAMVTGPRKLDGSNYPPEQNNRVWAQKNGYQTVSSPDTQNNIAIVGTSTSLTQQGHFIAFRGTEFASLQDWLINLGVNTLGEATANLIKNILLGEPTAAMAMSGYNNAIMHQGFLLAYQNLRSNVIETLQQVMAANPDIDNLYVTGHSLGGALAQLCAYDLKTNVFPSYIVRCVTFAAPLVGDSTWARGYNNLFPESFDGRLAIEFKTTNDIVPTIPTYLLYLQQGLDEGGIDSTPASAVATTYSLRSKTPFWSVSSFTQAHSLKSYYDALKTRISSENSQPNTNLTPQTVITSITLVITTSPDQYAGTDSQVLCLIKTKNHPKSTIQSDPLLGVDGGKKNPFQKNTTITSTLTFDNSDTPPASLYTVNDLLGGQLGFTLHNPSKWPDIAPKWLPTKVEVKINNSDDLATLSFDEWVSSSNTVYVALPWNLT